MIAEIIVPKEQLQKAADLMMAGGVNSVVIAEIPAGSVVSMRNGDLVITPASDGLKPSSVTEEDHF